MPQAKRSSSTASRSPFKQPAALKRLSTSLDTAQKALTELSRGSGRDVSKGATDLYKDLRGFVSSARRDSNKLAKALQREFDQAQKQLAKAASGTRSGASRSSTSRSSSSRSSTSRSSSARSSSAGGRAGSSRSSSSGSGSSSRSTSSRSGGGRSTAKRSGSGGSRGSTGTSKRGRSKS